MNAALPRTPERESRIAALRAAADEGTLRSVQRLVNGLHPAEIADLLESLSRTNRELVWDMVDRDLEGDVLVELNEEVRDSLIQDMDAEELVAATEGLEVDDLADLLAD